MAGDGEEDPVQQLSLGADGFDTTQGVGAIEVFVMHAGQSVADELFGDVRHCGPAAL